jgi:pimeloyl-ACP methyl ester carboxylesterase
MMVPDLEPFFGELRVLLPDVRGHGLSQKFERVADYTYARKAEDVLLWLDAVGVRSAIWGGASMGGALSLWNAVHAPERVRAVVSISGPPYAPRESNVRWWMEHRPLVEAGRFEDYFDANIRLRIGEAALARLKAKTERYRETIDRLRLHSVPSFLALLDETYRRTDWLADCARIRCPVLVIAGSEDPFPSVEQSRRVLRDVKGLGSIAAENVREAAQRLKERGRGVLASGRRGMQKVERQLLDLVEEHPFKSLLVAVAVGALLGLSMRRRQS